MKRRWVDKDKQKGFFDIPEPWEKEWEGMPEFVQEGRGPYQTIYVHFKNEEDIEDFAKLVRQRINPQTKFIWYPKAKHKDLVNYRCTDSNEDLQKEVTRKVKRRKRRRRRRT